MSDELTRLPGSDGTRRKWMEWRPAYKKPRLGTREATISCKLRRVSGSTWTAEVASKSTSTIATQGSVELDKLLPLSPASWNYRQKPSRL
jgi:hypothetical protein